MTDMQQNRVVSLEKFKSPSLNSDQEELDVLSLDTIFDVNEEVCLQIMSGDTVLKQNEPETEGSVLTSPLNITTWAGLSIDSEVVFSLTIDVKSVVNGTKAKISIIDLNIGNFCQNYMIKVV